MDHNGGAVLDAFERAGFETTPDEVCQAGRDGP